MPHTNVTPARIKGNCLYIQTTDRYLFNLGQVNIHLPVNGAAPMPATVMPQSGGQDPFIVRCYSLFDSNVPSLLPLQNGDVVHYQVRGNDIHITQVQKVATSQWVPPETSLGTTNTRATEENKLVTTNPRPLPRSRHTIRGNAQDTLISHCAPKLPDYLETNRKRIVNLPNQVLTVGNAAYNQYDEYPVMDRLKKKFENLNITQKDLIQLYTEWSDPVLGLIATAVWGGISTGGGTRDHLKLLLEMGEGNLLDRITRLRFLIRSGDFERAFAECSAGGSLKLNGVDYPYFTKLFCFIGHAQPALNPAPLILDKWTSNALLILGRQAVPEIPWTEIFNIEELGAWRTRPTPATYRIFISWFNHWASLLDCTALQLEQFVFGLSRKTQAGKSAENPRNQLINLGKHFFFPSA